MTTSLRRRRFRALLAMTAAASVTMAGLTTGPAWAADFEREAQSFGSTSASSVGAAESAFSDAAANWTGSTETAANTGDWTATDLSSAGSWSHGGSSGGYSYSYSMRVPPAAGPTPELALSYSSAAHDGLTSGTNNQASWIGDGWGYTPGFIERTYTGCESETEKDGNNGGKPTGDLCWDGKSPSITMALGGTNTSLVLDDATGKWQASGAENWRIDLLGSAATASAATTERWKVTGTDGTQYFFSADPANTASRWTVPVFGNHSGEACYKSGDFAGSRCAQAYRWMLDKVVDVHDNMTRYVYGTETGYYSPAADSTKTAVAYTRSGWLKRIEYGLRSDDPAVTATGRVQLIAADRCLSECYDTSGNPQESKWPDTPWELDCETGTGCEQFTPVFFSSKRLSEVSAEVWDTASGVFDIVDTWKLTHEFKDYGNKSQVVLWLASIKHTGHVGGTASMPAVEFGGTFMPNRVDDGSANPMIQRPRLTSIKNETGGVTTINYSEPDCGIGNLPTKGESNTKRCYPAKYTPEGTHQPVEAYFHKYVVTSVAESDTTGGSNAVWTFYEYSTAGSNTGVLWAWNDSEFTSDENRTYNQWRGYTQVTTLVGDPADPGPQLRSGARYYRGLDGQPLPDGSERDVTLTSTRGDTVADHEALAGQVWEQISYEDTTIVGSTATRYWTENLATRAHDGGELKAWITAPSRVDSQTRLAPGAWRHTRYETEYDQYGRATHATEHGELAAPGDITATGDEKCIETVFNDNTDAWILDAPKSVEVTSVRCGDTVDRSSDLVGAVRALYDYATSPDVPPTDGLMTRSETLENTAGNWSVLAESTFDRLGRETKAIDALGNATSTVYTPSGAGPVTSATSTNPLGHVTSAVYEPAWGAALSMTSANNQITSVAYDPLGRRTGVWLPGQDKATNEPANLKFSYKVSQSEPSATTTETMLWNQSYLTEIQIFDALMRPRQTQATTYGGRLLTQTEYNSYGQVTASSGANFNHDSGPNTTLVQFSRSNDVSRTEYVYDNAGRVTDEVFVVKDDERWRTTTVYGGNPDYWQTLTIPPVGGTTRAVLENAQGDAVELRQYHDRDASGEYDASKYVYNPDGQLKTVTTPDGLSWSFEYDLRGRQTVAYDPDTGKTTTTYNNAGQITSTKDANDTVLSYEYDKLGRTTDLWEGAVGSGKRLSEWLYDGALAYGKGRLYKSINYIDDQAWTQEVRRYSTTGGPTQVLTTLPAAAGALAGSYYESFTYNPDGSLNTSVANPKGGLQAETMTYGYNAMGQASRVSGNSADFGAAKIYVDKAVYSPYGQLLQRRLGDPADIGGTSGQTWQTWIYEEGTGRLAEFYFDKDTAGEFDGTNYGIAALSYEYDQAGNILSITDQPVHSSDALKPETQCFQYDYLRRLTEAWAQAGASECAAAPTENVVGGPGAYWSSYDYDKSGNRTAETYWTGSGRFTDTYTYETGSHALTEVATTENGNETNQYTYSSTGQAKSIDRAGDIALLDWTPTGRLNTVTNGEESPTRFFDDADGNRLVRIDPTGDVTAWVAGYELHYNATAKTVQATRYYHHGGEVIAQRVGKGDILFVSGDHHGTGQWIVNGGTLTATVRRHDPFGNERGLKQGTWPDDRGFVGGIDNDTTGLTTLGAREYDPTIGRFITVDPIADYADPQQLNGYAYALNNPINASDPSGLKAYLDSGSGDGIPNVDPNDDFCQDQPKGAVGCGNSGGTGNGADGTGGGDGEDPWKGWQWGDEYPGGGCDMAANEAVADPWGKCAPPLPDNPAIEEDPFLFYAYCAQYGIPQDQCEWLGSNALDLSFGDSTTADMIFNELTGLGDLEGCMEGDGASCAWLVVGFLPGGKLLKWADEAGSAIMKLVAKSCNSFVAGTPVLMADGTTKLIEEVEIGDKIVSVNTTTGETVTAIVDNTMATPGQLRDFVTIGIDSDQDGQADGQITATAGHVFWTIPPEAGHFNGLEPRWTAAGALEKGEWLQSDSGAWVQISGLKSHADAEGTFNLAVNSSHTYFVMAGREGILAHNCDLKSWTSQTNLNQHFDKHGDEMGFESLAEYQAAAVDLTCECYGRRDGVLTKVDGDTTYYFDPYSGEFAGKSDDGIFTYFIPDDGIDYFNRQSGR